MMSRYGYDNAGNRIWEMYSGLDVSGTAPVGLYQDSKIAYDELGRMGHISDVSYDIQYEYDAVGNRRAVRATYLDPLWNDVRRREDFWYTYDGANRFTLTKGTLEGNRRGTSLTDGTARIVQGAFGVALTYNGVGRRTSARYADNSFEEYFYSSDGFLEDTYITPDAGARKLRARRRVDSVGRTLQYKEYDSAGALAKTTDSVYDRYNRMLSSKDADGTTNYFYFINTNDIVSSATATGSGALAKTVFTPTDTAATGITTTYSYQYWDGAKQTAIMKKADTESEASWAPGTSDMRYDVNGFLTSARDNTGGRQFSYFNNASGQVLRRDERNEYSPSTATDDVTFVHYWYYANGRRVGEVTPSRELHQCRRGGDFSDGYRVYDALGRRIKHSNAVGWADETYYDSLGRVVRSTSAGGRETTYTYAFVAAGTAQSSGGIIGAGGANLGGWQLTTQGADGRKTVDRTDYFGRTNLAPGPRR
jgi:YD repeat-containing protein